MMLIFYKSDTTLHSSIYYRIIMHVLYSNILIIHNVKKEEFVRARVCNVTNKTADRSNAVSATYLPNCTESNIFMFVKKKFPR
jgi:hypothetical protein